jgi:hypothetical protein
VSMRFRLRTLMILTAAGPIALWLFTLGIGEGVPVAAWIAAMVLASEFMP